MKAAPFESSLTPSLPRHEDDGAAAGGGGEECTAVADLADDLSLLVDELELAELREAVEVYVARARGDGRQAEAGLGRDAQLYVALRRVEDVGSAAQKLRVEEYVADRVLGHDGLRAYARQLYVALARHVRANRVAVDVAYGYVARHRAYVDGGVGGHLYLEVYVAHIVAVVALHVYQHAVAVDFGRHLRRRGLHRRRHAHGPLLPSEDFDCARAVQELHAYVG